jgi:hypothetical protein
LFSHHSQFFFVSTLLAIITWNREILSTMANGTYGNLSGTSMAAAHVAGAAALLFSLFPNCTNNQIRNAMIRSTTKPPPTEKVHEWDQRYGWGIVNVGKAYELLIEGCVYAGGVYTNRTTSLSSQALGGKYQKAIQPSPMLPCATDPYCGAILDTWKDISGDSIADLRGGTDDLTRVPNQSTRLTSLLESPTSIDDNYGSRMKGWLVPPVTGTYSFWIAADDNGEFWLSTDSESANKVLACMVDERVSQNNFTAFSKQKSKPITLVAGQAYYYEVRQ